MSRRRAWITGAGGLIGSHLVAAAPALAPSWEVQPLTRQQLDLADPDAVCQAFKQDDPALIIHCAALSQSPICEQEPHRARQLNTEVTTALAAIARDRPLIFLSTDLVFDGKAGNYDEAAAPNPLSVYARTKWEAEQQVLRHPAHAVLRLSLNGGTSPAGNRGFNEQLRLAWKSGKTLTLFTDEFRCPMAASVTARAVWAFVERYEPGLFHLAGSERLSRWAIGQLLAARWPALDPRLVPGSLRDYSGAPRAPDTSLNCAKIQRLLPFRLPGFTEWLAAHPDIEF